MTDLRIRQAGPEGASMVLAADVYDGPAKTYAVADFPGPPHAPDPRDILLLAEVERQAVAFVSATVLDPPDKPPAPFIQELGVKKGARRLGIARALIVAIREAGRLQGHVGPDQGREHSGAGDLCGSGRAGDDGCGDGRMGRRQRLIGACPGNRKSHPCGPLPRTDRMPG